jgi:hypothetical protein
VCRCFCAARLVVVSCAIGWRNWSVSPLASVESLAVGQGRVEEDKKEEERRKRSGRQVDKFNPHGRFPSGGSLFFVFL